MFVYKINAYGIYRYIPNKTDAVTFNLPLVPNPIPNIGNCFTDMVLEVASDRAMDMAPFTVTSFTIEKRGVFSIQYKAYAILNRYNQVVYFHSEFPISMDTSCICNHLLKYGKLDIVLNDYDQAKSYVDQKVNNHLEEIEADLVISVESDQIAHAFAARLYKGAI